MDTHEGTYLPITNNAVFGWGLYNNPDICKELLETVLKLRIDSLDFITTEQEIKESLEKKSIRLDVFVRAGSRVFDIEVQMYKDSFLLDRLAYYQGLINSHHLDKGEHYGKLPESFIIFFCNWDVFGYGHPLYLLETACVNHPEVAFAKKRHWYIFNFNDYEKYQSTTGETKELLKYFSTSKVGSTKLVKDLDRMVVNLNSNSKWVNEVVTLDQQYKWNIQLAREEALAQGEARGRTQGEDRLGRLYTCLEKAERLQDFSRAVTNEAYRQELYKEFGI